MSTQAWANGSTISFDHSTSHVCNCIGCCTICGQCRTAPWHLNTCAQVGALKEQIGNVVRAELDRLKSGRDAAA